MTLTVEQVEDALRLNDLDWWDISYEDFEVDYLEIDGIFYPFEFVESETGHEGDWETSTYVIIKVGEQFFRKTGWYASHHGTEWDGQLTEVHETYQNVKVWSDK